jgi:superfamily II DNA or RNA helicase
LTLKPDHNVCIISPPSLLFNFVEALKQYGLDIKDNRYTFETYEKFCKRPSEYVDNKTLLIIDEVHNFRTLIALAQNKKGRIITDACTKCDKVLAMTGTPFVNKPYDIENIMAMISKRGNIQLLEKDFDKLIEDEAVLKDYFNYRISYFNIMATDGKTFFPTVSMNMCLFN